MQRLFVAVEISQVARQALVDYIARLRPLVPGVRFVSPQSWHVTLKFLGATDKVEEIAAALEAIRFPAVSFAMRSTGFFPDARRPQVFWAGIKWAEVVEPDIAGSTLPQLAQAVNATLTPQGFPTEKQPYHPHLTLAREGSGSPRPVRGERMSSRLLELAQKLPSQKIFDSVTMTAHEFVLFESSLAPSGAVYTPLRRFRLQ